MIETKSLEFEKYENEKNMIKKTKRSAGQRTKKTMKEQREENVCDESLNPDLSFNQYLQTTSSVQSIL